MVVVKN